MKAPAKVHGGSPARDAAATPPTRRQGSARHGQPLPTPLRGSLESQFGASLADVRIHDTAGAHRTAKQHRANAFTVGSDVYFGQGRYRPTQDAGRALITHEIAHVLQQTPSASPGIPVASAEREATAMAARSISQAVLPPVTAQLAADAAPLLSAATLKQAFEDELDDVFVSLDNVWPQIRQEPQPERDVVRRDGALERYIRSEASPEELLKTYLLLTYQREERFPVHFRDFLEATTEMVGTHEARVYAILRGVTQAERDEMARMPGFVEVIEDEMSGSELREAWNLLYGRVGRTGTGISPATSSTHLEMSQRYELAVEVGGSLETVEYNLTQAATASAGEVSRSVLLDDTSLWARLAEEFDRQEFWYLRMIGRYGGKDHFPRLTGPAAPSGSFLFPIWEAVKGAGTDEDKLFDTLDGVRAATGLTAPDAASIPGGLRPSAPAELQAEGSFLPMMEDELTANEMAQALRKLGAAAPAAAPAGRDALEDAIEDVDMEAIRDMLTDAALSPGDRRRLRTDPVILEVMGDELSGVQLCETSLLLTYGGGPFPSDVQTLLEKFEQDPIDVADTVTFLRSLTATAGALADLRQEPGVFFMLTNSGLSRNDVYKLLAAIRADQPGYQEPGSMGAYRHHRESVQAQLPVHFTSSEVRIALRCAIDLSRMKKPDEFDRGLLEDWLRDIDDVWNNRYELASGAATFDLVFAPYMAVGLASPNVTMYLMDWKGRSFVRSARDPVSGLWVEREMHLYLVDLGSHTVAHEFGHIFGNPDEYDLTASSYTAVTGTPAASPPPRGGQTVEGLMGSHYASTEITARHALPALNIINGVRDPTAFPRPFVLRRK